MEQCDCWGWLFGSGGLIETFGAPVVNRALELAKGQPPESNLMPYIYEALKERAPDSADEPKV